MAARLTDTQLALISQQEAERWGLVSKVVAPDQLEATARDWAERLAKGPTFAIGNVYAGERAEIAHLDLYRLAEIDVGAAQQHADGADLV